LDESWRTVVSVFMIKIPGGVCGAFTTMVGGGIGEVTSS